MLEKESVEELNLFKLVERGDAVCSKAKELTNRVDHVVSRLIGSSQKTNKKEEAKPTCPNNLFDLLDDHFNRIMESLVKAINGLDKL